MTRTVERPLLQRVELFRGLDAPALDAVLLAAQWRAIARSEVAFHQGDEGSILFVLVDGRLKVTQLTPEGQQVVIRFLAPGDMFGCVAVTGSKRYPGTATAVEDSRALAWTQATIRELMERHPKLAMNALATVGGRLEDTQSRLRELATERVERRIARALLRLAEQAAAEDTPSITASRQDIAEMSGTTLFTVSRTLSAWEAQGLVKCGRQRVTLRDRHGLAQVAAAAEIPRD